ncbi:hypothetical protein bpmyx0001_55780 [Bacillus pseudomycoides DSM 12442]|nr:hypothetical protein bpmyx0001_55780 [Bacillus pseudomycoides DSM 12442]
MQMYEEEPTRETDLMFRFYFGFSKKLMVHKKNLDVNI